MSKRQPPDTLPADFFSRQQTAPDTLPANFFDAKEDTKAILAQQAAKYPTAAEGAPQKANLPITAQLAIGAGKGILDRVKQGGDWIREKSPFLDSLPSLSLTTPINTAPSNSAQSFGHGLERAGEFAVGGELASGLTQGARLLPRMAAQGAAAYGVGRSQGQSPAEAGVSGVMGSVAPAAGEAWPVVKQWINGKVTPRALNALMEVKPQWLEYGRKPGERIIKEGIVSGTKDGLLVKVADKTKDAGTALEAMLIRDGAGKTIVAHDLVMNALENSTKRIGIGTDPAFQAKLRTILADIMGKYDITKMSPLEAQKLKSAIGDSIKWHGEPYEGDINKVLLEIYRGLNNATEEAVPGAKALLARYGDLKVAETALRDSITKDMARPVLSGHSILSNIMKMAGTGPITGAGQAADTFLNPGNMDTANALGRFGLGIGQQSRGPQ